MGKEEAPFLYQALQMQLATGRARLHMPGHKGVLPVPLREAALFDVTELPLTDSLYEARGCIARTEARFAALYGTGYSLLSAGGSTLCIQTMLALLGKGRQLVCDRNIHASALHAMGFLGQEPEWARAAQTGAFGVPRPPSVQEVCDALERCPQAAGVYITSPNYYGVLADIAGIARAAHERGIPLLVDNAHGAHLRFLQVDLHPMHQGADLCCDSLHKTLPALTGAALLHSARRDPFDVERARACMSWFGSSSPSYLILLSADLLADRLEDDLPAALRETRQRLDRLRERVPNTALGGVLQDPVRLSIPLPVGTDAQALRECLYQWNIEPELCDGVAAVLLCGADMAQAEENRLEAFMRDLPSARSVQDACVLSAPPLPERILPIRDAMFSDSVHIPLHRAYGRVAAGCVVRYPPGVPLIMYGERVDERVIFLLESTGITGLDVVK